MGECIPLQSATALGLICGRGTKGCTEAHGPTHYEDGSIGAERERLRNLNADLMQQLQATQDTLGAADRFVLFIEHQLGDEAPKNLARDIAAYRSLRTTRQSQPGGQE